VKSYNDVGDVSIIHAHWQHEIARFAVALPNEETAVLALVQQQLLGIFAHYVTVKPPVRLKQNSAVFVHKNQNAAVFVHYLH